MSEAPKDSREGEPLILVDQLPEHLGFVETDELSDLNASIMEAMRQSNWTAIKDLKNQYQGLAEEVVGQHEGDAFARAQIGLIVAVGLMWRAAGKLDSYGAELSNAHQYACNMRFDDVAEALEVAMLAVEDELRESEESEYNGPPTEEIIEVCRRELPVELHQELDILHNLPPDEVLEEVASLMIGSGVEEDPPTFFARMGWTL